MTTDSASIRDSFHRFFTVVPANTAALTEEAFRIRYEVYCRELGYEEVNRFPDGLEKDGYDDQSLHCLLQHKATDRFVGVVRIVIPQATQPRTPLPFEHACGNDLDRNLVDFDQLAPRSYAEISRLAVILNYRRRTGEAELPHVLIHDDELPRAAGQEERRSYPHIALGLSLAAVAVASNLGMERIFALMEPRLCRRLHTFGIRFNQIGPAISHKGVRAPFQHYLNELPTTITDDIRGLLDDIKGVVQRPDALVGLA